MADQPRRGGRGVAAKCSRRGRIHRRPEPRSAAPIAGSLRCELYRAKASVTPSICSPAPMPSSKARCGAGAQSAGGGLRPALLDRAILDALGCARRQIVRRDDSPNLPGIARTSLTPDITDSALRRPRRTETRRASTCAIRGSRHPLTAADRPASERVNDGLPETLEEVVSYYPAAATTS